MRAGGAGDVGPGAGGAALRPHVPRPRPQPPRPPRRRPPRRRRRAHPPGPPRKAPYAPYFGTLHRPTTSSAPPRSPCPASLPAHDPPRLVTALAARSWRVAPSGHGLGWVAGCVISRRRGRSAALTVAGARAGARVRRSGHGLGASQSHGTRRAGQRRSDRRRPCAGGARKACPGPCGEVRRARLASCVRVCASCLLCG